MIFYKKSLKNKYGLFLTIFSKENKIDLYLDKLNCIKF